MIIDDRFYSMRERKVPGNTGFDRFKSMVGIKHGITPVPAPANALFLNHGSNTQNEVTEINGCFKNMDIDTATYQFRNDGKFGGCVYGRALVGGRTPDDALTPLIREILLAQKPSTTFSAYVRKRDVTGFVFGVGYRHFRNSWGGTNERGIWTTYQVTDGKTYITGFKFTDGYPGNINHSITFATPIEVDSVNWHRAAFYISSTEISFYFDGTLAGTMNFSDVGITPSDYGDAYSRGMYFNYLDLDEIVICEGLGGITPEAGPYYLPQA